MRISFVIGGAVTFAAVIWWAATVSGAQANLKSSVDDFKSNTVKRLTDIEALLTTKTFRNDEFEARLAQVEKYGSQVTIARLNDLEKKSDLFDARIKSLEQKASDFEHFGSPALIPKITRLEADMIEIREALKHKP